MKFIFTPTAQEDFDRLTRKDRKRVADKLRFYASQANPLEHAERLTDSHEYPFRVGDYRVTFEVLHGALWINAIKRRDEAYK
jgi:mRNA-degrading endonuclease RelE of RelBE toxin-antitoxin system